MPYTKPVARAQRHIHRALRGKILGRLQQMVGELDAVIAQNGGPGDSAILASWGNAEFGVGFKALVDAARAFDPVES